jgi:hypothetical protein
MWLTLVVAFGITQLLAPGFGDNWFGDAYRPAGWVADQGRPYYLTQLAVLLGVILIAICLWLIGHRNLISMRNVIEEQNDEIDQDSAEIADSADDEDSEDLVTEEPASNN